MAVPNFINARLRALVSRTMADVRTLANAVDMYRIDSNTAPFRQPGWPCGLCPEEQLTSTYNISPITTPVAYISSIPFDPSSTSPAPNWATTGATVCWSAGIYTWRKRKANREINITEVGGYGDGVPTKPARDTRCARTTPATEPRPPATSSPRKNRVSSAKTYPSEREAGGRI